MKRERGKGNEVEMEKEGIGYEPKLMKKLGTGEGRTILSSEYRLEKYEQNRILI